MGRTNNTEFKKTMKKTHKILLPNMLHYHNELLQAAFEACGYQLEILPEKERLSDYALPYISGDYCLPAMLILGQMMAFVQSRECDLEHIAFMEPQTGGACRAGNYYNSMIESLQRAGYSEIPVISLNVLGEEKHEGFSVTPKLLIGAVAAICYGDLLMMLTQRIRPYEREQGSAETCRKKWIHILSEDICCGYNISAKKRKGRYREIIKDFKVIPTEQKTIRKVGITGEIYMKFSPIGNEHLEKFLQKGGYDYRMGGFVNYAIYVVDGELKKQQLLGAGRTLQKTYTTVIRYLEKTQRDLHDALKENNLLKHDADFAKLKKLAGPIICGDCNIGDGWLIAGEAADLIEQGYQNILILHPFGCLVSHVCVRGILKKLRERYPGVNIQSIEYDYDSSKTLRESRILLGISGK